MKRRYLGPEESQRTLELWRLYADAARESGVQFQDHGHGQCGVHKGCRFVESGDTYVCLVSGLVHVCGGQLCPRPVRINADQLICPASGAQQTFVSDDAREEWFNKGTLSTYSVARSQLAAKEFRKPATPLYGGISADKLRSIAVSVVDRMLYSKAREQVNAKRRKVAFTRCRRILQAYTTETESPNGVELLSAAVGATRWFNRWFVSARDEFSDENREFIVSACVKFWVRFHVNPTSRACLLHRYLPHYHCVATVFLHVTGISHEGGFLLEPYAPLVRVAPSVQDLDQLDYVRGTFTDHEQAFRAAFIACINYERTS